MRRGHWEGDAYTMVCSLADTLENSVTANRRMMRNAPTEVHRIVSSCQSGPWDAQISWIPHLNRLCSGSNPCGPRRVCITFTFNACRCFRRIYEAASGLLRPTIISLLDYGMPGQEHGGSFMSTWCSSPPRLPSKQLHSGSCVTIARTPSNSKQTPHPVSTTM
jgi:hypothetical protein